MAVKERMEEEKKLLISLTTDIVVAYIGNNNCQLGEVSTLIRKVYTALQKADEDIQEEVVFAKPKPAVHPKRSITGDYLICLEDGRKFKSLKRHLMTHYKMTPDEYREKWGLDANYPMVAPNYASERSRLARQTGLGRKTVTRKAGK